MSKLSKFITACASFAFTTLYSVNAYAYESYFDETLGFNLNINLSLLILTEMGIVAMMILFILKLSKKEMRDIKMRRTQNINYYPRPYGEGSVYNSSFYRENYNEPYTMNRPTSMQYPNMHEQNGGSPYYGSNYNPYQQVDSQGSKSPNNQEPSNYINNDNENNGGF